MTTEARNEAADYLRLGMPKPLHAKLGEALAAERRATVERIRAEFSSRVKFGVFGSEPEVKTDVMGVIDAILDEVAAR